MDLTAGIVSEIEAKLREFEGTPTYIALGRYERDALSDLINTAHMIQLPSGAYNVYSLESDSHIGLFFGQDVL